MNFGGSMTFLVLVLLALVGFVIYYIFKQIQFVLQAVDLYKAMVVRLDKIIEVLAASPGIAHQMGAIPSGATPSAAHAAPRELEPLGVCPNCEARIPLSSPTCPKCKAAFGAGSAWKVRPN